MDDNLAATVVGTDGPLILFGAFDRHNLGDLLLAHAARLALAGRQLVYAGLANRDLRAVGGLRVEALPELARRWGECPAHLIHVGGELLTCDAWQAAVMLQTSEIAADRIRRFDADPVAREAWARAELGIDWPLAYVPPRRLFQCPGRFIYRAVGGVGVAGLAPALQRELGDTLRAAHAVTVRDALTRRALASLGVHARQESDPVVYLGPWLSRLMLSRHARRAWGNMEHRFPQGWIVLQFAAALGDDRFLRALAEEVDELSQRTGWGVVTVCAGTAPWHDDPAVYRRWAGFCRTSVPYVVEDAHVASLCGLIGRSRAVLATSLHVRLVADALGVPAWSLAMGEGADKLRAVLAGTPATHLLDAVTGIGRCVAR